MTAIKVCGMRHPDDIEACREADYLGFVVSSVSHRNLGAERARELMSLCDNTKVMVTTETNGKSLEAMVSRLEPDVLQLHSAPDLDLMERMSACVETWAVLGVREGACIGAEMLGGCSALLLDSPGRQGGGTGRVHDWSISRRIRDALHPFPVILAGGLMADNLENAISVVRPYGVDMSSSLEAAGGKDPGMVREAIDRIRGRHT